MIGFATTLNTTDIHPLPHRWYELTHSHLLRESSRQAESSFPNCMRTHDLNQSAQAAPSSNAPSSKGDR